MVKSSVMNHISQIKYQTIILVLTIFGLITVCYTFWGFKQAQLGVFHRSDQIAIGTWVLKLNHPELFSRDPVYHDATYFEFYTPSYLWLIGQFIKLTGSYEFALVGLIPITIMVYLIGMFVLVHYLTENAFAACSIAIISSIPRNSVLISFWGLVGFNNILARSIFMTVAPWLIYLFFISIFSKKQWNLPLVAFFVGLSANLHPVSGFCFSQLFLSVVAVTRRKYNLKSAMLLTSLVVCIFLGASPILFNFNKSPSDVQNISPSMVIPPNMDISFSEYAETKENALRIFPSFFARFFEQPLDKKQQEFLIWAYLGIIGTCFVVYRLFNYLTNINVITFNYHNLLFIVLLIIQLPIAHLFTGMYGLRLVLIVFFYGVYVILLSKPTKWDWILLYLLIFAVSYTYIATYFLKFIWLYFEIWSLTGILQLQMRMVRFIYLPLYLYIAFFINIITTQSKLGTIRFRQILLFALTCFLLFEFKYLYSWSVILCVVVILQSYFHKTITRYNWLSIGIQTVILILFLKALSIIINIPLDKWLLLYFIIPYVIIQIVQNTSYKLSLAKVRFLTTIAISVIFIGVNYLYPSQFLVQPVGNVWKRVDSLNIPPNEMSERNKTEFELYDWVKKNTDVNSLFYYGSSNFRFYTQRSVTHAKRNIGRLSSRYPTSTGASIYFGKEYRAMQDAFRDDVKILSYPKKYDADYIIIEAHPDNVSPDLPVAFQNDFYTVYDIRAIH